jgi:hypothetical protein
MLFTYIRSWDRWCLLLIHLFYASQRIVSARDYYDVCVKHLLTWKIFNETQHKEFLTFQGRKFRTISLQIKLSLICRGKAIPIETWTGPECSRRLKLSDFKTIGTWRWYVCQPYSPALFIQPLHPWGNIFLTFFCYRLSRPNSQSSGGNSTSIKSSNDTIGNRTCKFSVKFTLKISAI